MDSCLLCHTPLQEQNLALNRTFSGYSVRFDLFRCPACRFLQTVPMPPLEIIQEEYGNEYMAYNQRDEKKTLIAAAKRLSTILKHCDNKRAPLKLLDVGCSTGWFLHYAQSQGFDVYGVELSQYAAKQAMAKLGECRVQNTLLERSSFKESDFDIIYSNQVIEHTPEPVLFLSVITKYLKKDGLLFLGTPNGDSLAMQRLGGNWASVQKPDHLVFFNPENLRTCVEKNGCTFKQIYWTGSPFLPTRHTYKSFVDDNINLRNKTSNRCAVNKTAKEYIMSSRVLSFLVSFVTNVFHLGDTFVLVAKKK